MCVCVCVCVCVASGYVCVRGLWEGVSAWPVGGCACVCVSGVGIVVGEKLFSLLSA